MKDSDINYYDDYVSPIFKKYLDKETTTAFDIEGLRQVGATGGLESAESFKFLISLYDLVKKELKSVLDQRVIDRKFIDERVKSYYEFNNEYNNDFTSKEYKTILGDVDADQRIVIGPKIEKFYHDSGNKSVAPIPEYLKGNHITLFGPPEGAKLSINAMNAYHRKLKDEPKIIEEILKTHDGVPKWGADDEDSKTPLRSDLITAGENLTGCLNGDLSFKEERTGKEYKLSDEKRSFPIKRFPGLALPCSFLFYHESAIPLHLYDFALHLFENWHNPKALVFYVPKLENEEEARYIKNMIEAAENLIKAQHPEYKLGTVRVIIVLENPRAVFRVNEMMDELYPYFVGASLGWHDYLGSTARLFKEDGNYRIPVKADPDIVIKYIKASHDLLANVVGKRGGIKIGGMYGILPINNELFGDSFQITIKGFFRDVITQMKRDLSGFWVAHPDFVRIGMAIVEAWKFYANGEEDKLKNLINALLNDEYSKEIWSFVKADDIKGLDTDDDLYDRSLIVADMSESNFIANNHPDEIRYNVFQSLQYLTDWLSGNGCVALPSMINDVPVRVMDDLATAERSRWEVWHELHHGRFSIQEFIKIAHEEMNFIRRDLSDSKKIVQVKYTQENAKWYPVAFKLMLKLMTDKNPVEFATELLIPFTINSVRDVEDPWNKISKIDPKKFEINPIVDRMNYYFEMCGCTRFASELSQNIAVDHDQIKGCINSFSEAEIIEAASFHGNIGESSKNLDAMAKSEQKKVSSESDSIKNQLLTLGQEYLDKFGFKFLISAKDKSADYLLTMLQKRMLNNKDQELTHAREALFEITLKRIESHPFNALKKKLADTFNEASTIGAQLTISSGLSKHQSLCFGDAIAGKEKVKSETLFEIASLSKTYACVLCIELFRELGISLETSVNELLDKYGSDFRLTSTVDKSWESEVQLKHLMGHSALNMHYVNGVPSYKEMPDIKSFLTGNSEYDYPPVDIIHKPGTKFQYSGAGFLVLEYIFELVSKKKLSELAQFNDFKDNGEYTHGYSDKGVEVDGGIKRFPKFAAGMFATSKDINKFLEQLAIAYNETSGCGDISHDTAIMMLDGKDLGCKQFMNSTMGLGVFIVEAGENRFMLHQGANDGFRAIYLYCFKGPNCYQGLSILCNGELEGVILNSKLSQVILKELNISGIDFSKFNSKFSLKDLPQEEIVNIGYKKLLLEAFYEDLPEPITRTNERLPLSEYNLLSNSKIVSVTNQRFARAENLISPYVPIFDPKLFGKQGKVMDSWETSRHNQQGFDEIVLQLDKASEVNYISISTMYHFGNQVEEISVTGFSSLTEEILLNKIKLEGHSYINIALDKPTTKLDSIKVRVYPDGGITRLGLFKSIPDNFNDDFKPLSEAKCIAHTEIIPETLKPMTIDFSELNYKVPNNNINYASAAYGAKVLAATDEHYAPALSVLSPYPPLNMFDGLESKRSRDKGHFEQVEIELADTIDIGSIVLDFTYFVNNNPNFIQVEHYEDGAWKILVEKTQVKAYAGNKQQFSIKKLNSSKLLKLSLFPDGGINRILVFKK